MNCKGIVFRRARLGTVTSADSCKNKAQDGKDVCRAHDPKVQAERSAEAQRKRDKRRMAKNRRRYGTQYCS